KNEGERRACRCILHEQLRGPGPLGEFDAIAAEVRKLAAKIRALLRVVIDDEDLHASPFGVAAFEKGTFLRILFQRQNGSENGTNAEIAFDGNVAVHQMDQFLADRE